jgi:hypothetical protein
MSYSRRGFLTGVGATAAPTLRGSRLSGDLSEGVIPGYTRVRRHGLSPNS